MFEALIAKGFEVERYAHAKAILTTDFPAALSELEDALLTATIPVEEIIAGGGRRNQGWHAETPTCSHCKELAQDHVHRREAHKRRPS